MSRGVLNKSAGLNISILPNTLVEGFEKVVYLDTPIQYNLDLEEVSIVEDYCGYDFMGIKGRFRRAWKAFWARPICYNGIYCQDGKRMRKFLEDCLSLMDEVGE